MVMEKKDYFMGMGIVTTGVLLVLLIIVTISVLAFFTGGTGFAFICEEQSRQKLDTCNIDCGEGILSELCKTKCTIEHNERMDECVGK
jgi:hypothetical protein